MSTPEATAGHAPAADRQGGLGDAERAERAMASLARSLDARTSMNLDACIHCGMCADACHFHVATDDARYIPILKAEPLKRVYKRECGPFAPIFRLLGLSRPFTGEDLAEWQHLLYDSCNLCGRCSLICPMGIDVAGLVAETRHAMFDAGLAPRELYEAAESQYRSGVPGTGGDPYRDRLLAIGDDYGVDMPLDKARPDVLVTLSSLELEQYPGQVAALARVMHHLRVPFTFLSEALLADNFAYYAGSRDWQRHISQGLIEQARACGAETVIVPECGHAYTALRWEAADLVGEPLPFRVLHVSEFLAEELDAGRLRLRQADGEPVTFQDPCQVVRKGGVIEAPRALLKAMGIDVRETGPHVGFGYCCGGGGGVNMIGRADELRYRAVEVKFREIAATGAERVITTCAGCRHTFDDARGHARGHVPPESLLELVAGHLDGAEEKSR